MNILLNGGSGRVGRAIHQIGKKDHQFCLYGRNADFKEADFKACEVVMDFSNVQALPPLLKHVALAGKPLVTGTTGLLEKDKAAIYQLSKRVAVVRDDNFSLGVNLLFRLVEMAACKLDESFQVEILELHHKHKVDAPSGTAKKLAGILQKARQLNIHALRAKDAADKAHGGSEVSKQQLNIHALRAGDAAGEHTVFFAGEGERLELTHRAATVDIFAKGALRAARWVARQHAGLYQMEQVLGWHAGWQKQVLGGDVL